MEVDSPCPEAPDDLHSRASGVPPSAGIRREPDAATGMYSNFCDFAPVGCFTLDEESRILDVNATGAALLGAARSELVSQPLSRFVTGEDRAAFEQHRALVFKTGTLQRVELSILRMDGTPPVPPDAPGEVLDIARKGERAEHPETARPGEDGTRVDVALTLAPLQDASGTVAGISAVAHDISELNAMRRALQEANVEAQKRVEACRLELTHRNRDLLQAGHSERRQRLFAEALVQAALALNTSLYRDTVLDRILEQAQRVIQCRAVAVLLLQEDSVQVARYRGSDVSGEVSTDLGIDILPDVVSIAKNGGASGQSAVFTDEGERSGWCVIPGLEWVRSHATVPMNDQEGPIGFLNVFSDRAGAFTQESIDLLQAFAAHAVVAIRNAEIFTSAVEARRVAETFSSASLALTRTLDLNMVLETLLDYLHSLVPYDSASVMLLRDRTHLAIQAVRGSPRWNDSREGTAGTIKVRTIPLLNEILTTGEGSLVPDIAQHPGWVPSGGEGNTGSWLGVPLAVESEVIGICGLDKAEPGFFSSQHKQLATALVGQAAVAVQNARLFTEASDARRRLQSLSQRLVEIQEAERRYIARELHDEAGQWLTSLAVRLQLLERDAGRPEAVVAGVKELGRTVETVSEDLHRLAMALRPASLDHLGLVVALRQYVQGVGSRHGLAVQFEVVGFQRRLSVDLETALFRIVQEALTNVIRHSQATRVDVVLEQLGDRLVVIVEDDGIGFEVEAGPPGEHLGLIGIRERVEMLGGKLRLESTGNGGTTLSVEVPYATADTHRR